MNSSIHFYGRTIKILTSIHLQLGFTYILYAESQKVNGLYTDAIGSYLNAEDIKPDPNLYMIIANLNNEKLKDKEKAIFYYQRFLDNINDVRLSLTPEYAETIKQRLEYIKAILPEKN